MGTVKYFLEHLEDLLLDSANPEKSATLFGLIFQVAPTYEELSSGTPELAPFLALKGDSDVSYSQMVTPEGFEPSIFWMKTRYPRPLDDGAIVACQPKAILACQPKAGEPGRIRTSDTLLKRQVL